MRAAVVVVLAGALAFPAATGARADPCAADRRLVDAWHKVLADNGRITTRQMTVLTDIFRRLSTNQAVPRETVDELRTLVTRNRQQLAAGERRIVRIRPGTASGRELKGFVLRFIRVVARPLNTCIGKVIDADTPEDFDKVVKCVDSSSRARIALSRDLDRAVKRVSPNRSVCRP